MPRIRTVKPELATDVKLARVSRDARYTFVLLITQADDEGLVAGSLRQLLGTLYPHDDGVSGAMLLHWLEELVEVGIVRWRATRDGAPVVELVNWQRHQRVDHKGRSQLATELVPVEDTPDDIANGGSPRVSRESREEVPRLSRTDLGPRTKDLGPVLAGSRATGRDADAEFADFWRAYPRRAGGNPRGKAFKAWCARLAEGVPPSAMLDGGQRYATYCVATGKLGTEFVLQGATFLGPDRRFEDDWALPVDGGATARGSPSAADEMTRAYGEWFTEALHPRPAKQPA
jgi:hypothetical protein